MKNYTEGIDENILVLHNIHNLTVICNEIDGWNPRMLVTYLDNSEKIIDGDNNITSFVNQL